MSDARAAILARIWTALSAPGTVPRPPNEAGDIRRGDADADADRIETFVDRARSYKVRVEVVARADAADTVGRVLRERGHRRLLVPDGFEASLLPSGLEILRPDVSDRDAIGGADGVLTTCACAIAQTGTIVLDHGPGQGPRILTLLPDYHLAVVDADRIVGLVPEAVARMEPAVRQGRPLTFVSGPSATSDIELSRVEGVHGPRTLDLVVLR